MRFIMCKSVMLPGTSVKNWVSGVLWLLLVSVFASAYIAGRVSVSTLVVVEGCVIALGAIVWRLEAELNEPPEIVEQLLYRTEHPTRS